MPAPRLDVPVPDGRDRDADGRRAPSAGPLARRLHQIRRRSQGDTAGRARPRSRRRSRGCRGCPLRPSAPSAPPSRRCPGRRMSRSTASGCVRRIAARPDCAVTGGGDLQGRTRQIGAEQVERGPVVLDHDDLAGRLRDSRRVARDARGRRARGARSRRCCPRPTSLSSHMRPPSSSTMRRDRVRPSPVPSSRELRVRLAGRTRRSARGRPRGTPMPVSVTVIRISAPSVRRAGPGRSHRRR